MVVDVMHILNYAVTHVVDIPALTLIHAIQYLVEFFFRVVTVVFSPVLARLAPQNHQLPLRTTQGSKVGDLHDHRSTVQQFRERKTSEEEE